MGRGRAKAKQTKVARELKYSSPSTDFSSLQQELSGSSSSSHRTGVGTDQRSDSDGRSRWDDDDSDDWRR
ncbi:DUF3073 domain-containing protein [Rhodococcus tukisamuensis]|uniref:DUF3073 domain-containing protein n=1 Tax=Rhodococcus tukisamuensis TaxID=168276 RepID=A0A1G6NYE3_9NOCA|nr:DUF3073 domain-containing protein [Rhodococcus tukisamuensis]SDC72681.1 Protein of unknown function [Rhodococcus tukisamuensis]